MSLLLPKRLSFVLPQMTPCRRFVAGLLKGVSFRLIRPKDSSDAQWKVVVEDVKRIPAELALWYCVEPSNIAVHSSIHVRTAGTLNATRSKLFMGWIVRTEKDHLQSACCPPGLRSEC